MMPSRSTAISLVVAILPFVFRGICTAQANAPQTAPVGQAEALRPIVSQFVEKSASLGCNPKCKIVITDFLLSQGHTSNFGIQIAETLGALLSNESKGFAVVDRSRVQDFLEQERLPDRVVNQPDVARWLAGKLNADIAVTGETTIEDPKGIELALHFSDARAKHNSLNLNTTYRVETAEVNLNAIDTLRPLPPLQDTVNGKRLYRAGANGVGLPSCYDMPNPPYAEETKAVHFSGIILVEGPVDAEGKVKLLRIVTGAPGGLNEVTMRTLATWRCRPAELNGKPVPTVVPFEVNFRLY